MCPRKRASMDTTPVTEGQPAPDFTLPSTEGRNIALDSFRGHPVVIYFLSRHAGLHHPGLRAARCLRRTDPRRGGRPRRQPRRRGLARALRPQVRSALSAAQRSRPRRQRTVWGSGRSGPVPPAKRTGASCADVHRRPDGTLRHVWPRVKPDTHADKLCGSGARAGYAGSA